MTAVPAVKPVSTTHFDLRPWQSRKPAWAGPVTALVVYLALAVLTFINTWVHPFTYAIGSPGDSPQFMWFLGWSAFALTHFHNPFFTTYLDYPVGVNMLWNCTVPLLAALLTPITATLGPVFSYNVLETLAVALSAWTAYLFIHRFVGNSLAAGVGGLLYGFSPAMMAQSLGHPHITAAFLPPLMLLVLDEIYRVQRRPALLMGLALGALAAAQLLIGEEILALAAVVIVLGTVLMLVLKPGQFRARAPYALRALGVAALVALVLAAGPVAFQFFGPQHITGIVHPANIYVSNLYSFFIPTRMQLLAPGWAVRISEQWSGNLSEWNSYVGVPLIALLGYTVVRFWNLVVIRLATLMGILIALLSLGITFHYGARTTQIPVFIAAFAFPAFQRVLPGRAMLYLTALGWLAFSRFPVLGDLIPSRFMLYGFLCAGLVLAVFAAHVYQLASRQRKLLGGLLTALALIPLIPSLPYWSTAQPVPSFFTSSSARRIPDGSVALVLPLVDSGEDRPMLWAAATGMRFRSPMGYVFIPKPGGNQLDPPYSVTHATFADVVNGRQSIETLGPDVRKTILSELAAWHVKTVVVGPMPYEDQAVTIMNSLLNRPAEQVGGVYVWWDVNPNA